MNHMLRYSCSFLLIFLVVLFQDTGAEGARGQPLTDDALMKSIRELQTMDFCGETFGAKMNVVTSKIEAPAKAELFLKAIAAPPSMSGKEW